HRRRDHPERAPAPAAARGARPLERNRPVRSSPRFSPDHWRCQVTLYERFEKVSEADMTKTTRRRLLARAGKVCVGIAAGAAGLSRVSLPPADSGRRTDG